MIILTTIFIALGSVALTDRIDDVRFRRRLRRDYGIVI